MSPAPLSIVTHEQGSGGSGIDSGRVCVSMGVGSREGPVLQGRQLLLGLERGIFLTGHSVAGGSCHKICGTVQ